MNYVFIYALIDPFSKEVRYVGKAKNPYLRLIYNHIKDMSKTHKAFWIQSLIKQSAMPVLAILEQCENTKCVWEERERDWIAFGKRIGWPLTNGTDGGEGGPGGWLKGKKRSPEAIRKFIVSMTGKRRSEKTKELMKKNHVGMIGKKHSIESRNKMSSHHRMFNSEETKRKLRLPRPNYPKNRKPRPFIGATRDSCGKFKNKTEGRKI
jgi:hypothetical protein